MSVIGRRARGRGNDGVEARIREVLAQLRPLIGHQASRVELLNFTATSGVATLAVEGGCPDCDMPAAALLQGIGAHLRLRVPEVRDVRAADSHTPHHG
jgi:Fe-S cluster biogenesis protein NfuA